MKTIVLRQRTHQPRDIDEQAESIIQYLLKTQKFPRPIKTTELRHEEGREFHLKAQTSVDRKLTLCLSNTIGSPVIKLPLDGRRQHSHATPQTTSG
ncbi:hypothetical protein MRB53_038350 [Persea americana]|nr:hypothetical protein MRB53_038350 [Persea americana]